MDIVSTIYQELFSVKFLHAGYGVQLSDTISNDIKLAPDAGTEELFKNYNISYRLFNDTLVCFMRSKLFNPPARNPKVPFVSFFTDVRIRFLMFTTQNFMRRTGVIATGKTLVYQFSNTINNVIAADTFISKPVAGYTAAEDYDAGAIVNSGGGLFITIMPVHATDNISINDITFWKPVAPVEQLVNNDDVSHIAALEVSEPCFAVIDIFNNGTTNASYDLFLPGPDSQMKSPVYSIRFKSKI